jgi:hypothetical protein
MKGFDLLFIPKLFKNGTSWQAIRALKFGILHGQPIFPFIEVVDWGISIVMHDFFLQSYLQ